MNKKVHALCLLLLLSFSFQGCKVWHTLKYETENQPIQLGPNHTTSGVDTLGVITGYYKQHIEEAVYSESESGNLSVTLGGEDYREENLSSTIYKALRDNPDHFIADGTIEVEVSYGVTFWGFLKNVIAGAITGGESSGGEYSTETIRYSGVVYKIKRAGDHED